MSKEFDVAIIGAGPGGSTAAIKLAEGGKRVALIDKASFPRDKVCGDGLTPDVANQLMKFFPEVYEDFKAKVKFNSKASSIYLSGIEELSFNLSPESESKVNAMARYEFDDILFKHAISKNEVEAFENSPLKSITGSAENWVVEAGDETLYAKYIIGADGANGKTARILTGEGKDMKNYAVAVRCYFEGIEGVSEEKGLEFFMPDYMDSGYFWIFPLGNGKANVGWGLRAELAQKQKVNLRDSLFEIIEKTPEIKARFKEAKALEDPIGFGLPLGGKNLRKIAGPGFLLIGDAAYLIDPVSGEGIGNAIRSARFAAEAILEAKIGDDFQGYKRRIQRKIYPELVFSKYVQKSLENRFIFLRFWKPVLQNPRFKRLLTEDYSLKKLKRKMLNPFYLIGLLIFK